MPQIIPCPECANRIRVTDDLVGKRVRCPRCGKPFDALPVEDASHVMAVYDPLPEPTASRHPTNRDRERANGARSPAVPTRLETPLHLGDTERWESVLSGVKLQMIAHLLAILGVVMLLGASFLLAASLNERSANSPTFGERLLGVGVLIGSILLAANWIVSLTANGFALSAPMARGSRPLAVSALVITALVLVTVAASQLSESGSSIMDFGMGHTAVVDPGPGGGRSLGIESHRIAIALAAALSVVSLTSLLEGARLILVPLFVRTVGQNLRDRGTADRARISVWVVAVVFFATLGVELLVRLRSRFGHTHEDDTKLALLLSFALAAARLLILIAGLYSLSRAKATLTRHLSAAVRAEVP